MPDSVKRVLKNSFFQTMGAFGVTGLNFLLMLGYARILGPEKFGSLVTSQAQVLVWALLVDLGLSNGLIGALTSAEGEKSELARQGFRSQDLILRVLGLRLLGAFVGSIAVLSLAYLHAKHGGVWNQVQFNQDISFLPYLYALAFMQTAFAYGSFRERQGVSVVANLIGTAATAFLSLYFAWRGENISTLLLSQSWGGLLCAAIIFSVVGFGHKRKFEDITRRQQTTKEGPWGGEAWRALYVDAWPYAFVFAAFVLWQRLDQITASHFLGYEAGGQYALAVRLVAIPILIASSVVFAIFPDMQRLGRDSPEKIALYIGLISKFLLRFGFFIAAGILLVAGHIVVPMVPKFRPALDLLPWFIPGIWGYWMQSFMVSSLFGLRKYKAIVIVHIISLLAYLLALPTLTQMLGIRGVACAYDVFCLLLSWLCFRLLKQSAILDKNYSLFSRYSEKELELIREVRG